MKPLNFIKTNCFKWFIAIDNWFQSKLSHFLGIYKPKMAVYRLLTPCKNFVWHETIKYHQNQLY